MRFSGRFIAGLALVLTSCWALALAFSGSTDTLLYLAPLLLLAAPLVAGRYVGESLVLKLASIGRRRRPRPRRARPLPKAPSVWSARGARMIAFSLAERPPPAAALLQT
jgi:hypothetical protein